MEEKVAVKSGYYFEIFNKSDIPNTLVNSNRKVKLNDEVFDLYKSSSLQDERVIDDMFGTRMGHSIDEHILKPRCALIGQDGNIFNLMGIASRTLKQNGLRESAKEMCDRITSEAKSYDQALMILDEYVDIVSQEEMEEDEFE